MRIDIDKDDNLKTLIDFNNTILLTWNDYGIKIEDEYSKSNNKIEIKDLYGLRMTKKQTFIQKIRLMIKLFKIIFF